MGVNYCDRIATLMDVAINQWSHWGDMDALQARTADIICD